jgi:uncharacterized RDD family membrane protein YckC
MPAGQADHSLGTGVYYASEDYVGFAPRLLILAVDLLVIAAALMVTTSLVLIVSAGNEGLMFAANLLIVWLYLVPLKRSRTRTVGYWLTGCRLVTLKGTRPSLLTLTMRLGLWGFGPANVFFDVIWCGIDQEEQTLRDRFTSVCVVRNRAEPLGEAAIHMAYYTVMGYCIILPRVQRPVVTPLPESASA